MYEDIIKLSQPFTELKADIENGSVSHAYLFSGSDTVFCEELCRCFLYELVLSEAGMSVAQKVLNGTMADIMYFPETSNMSVADIEFITENALVTPLELKRKYYVIKKAQTMTAQAQNKLLKILEEPPSVTGFIIISKGLNALLPTIVSRCRMIEIKPFTDEEILHCLRMEQKHCDKRELFAALCCGNLTTFEDLLNDSSYDMVFEKILDMLENMTHSSMAVRYLAFFNEFKDYFDWILTCMELIFSDILKNIYNVKIRLPGSFVPQIDKLSQSFSAEAVAELMSEFAYLRERKKFYGNYNSMVDELLLKILEVKSKWQKL